MTVLFGITDGEKTWMSADSGVVVNGRTVFNTANKIKQIYRDDTSIAISTCGSEAASTLFMLEDYIKRVSTDVSDPIGSNNWARTIAHYSNPASSRVMLGVPGKLWAIANGEAIQVPHYIGLGSGGDIAMGVAYALIEASETEFKYDRITHIAVAAACNMNIHCDFPIKSVVLEGPVGY